MIPQCFRPTLRLMGKRGPVSERLRDFVRARCRKDGALYVRGNGVRLAAALEVDSGWVTTYTDHPPTAHATLDQAVAICRFYGVDLSAFVAGKTPKAQAPIDPALLAALQDEGTKEDVLMMLAAPAPLRRLHAEAYRLLATTLGAPPLAGLPRAKARGAKPSSPALPRRASGHG
jgi:nucleotide-binding universal stress UspA family protein